MKLTVSKTELQARLTAISKMIPSKPSLPIMASFLFETKGGQLHLTAASSEGQIKTSIECEANVDIKFCIPAATLLDALKALPEQPIKIEVNETNFEIKIQYAGGKFEMMGETSFDFPVPKEFEKIDTITLHCQEFHSGIARIQHLAADNELRPALCTVFVEAYDDNCINFVGTDGHGLGVVKVISPDSNFGKSSLMISRKIAGILKSIVPASNEDITISIGPWNANITFSDYDLTFRLTEGKYPNYCSVIPENSKILRVNTADLKGAINRVSIFSDSSNTIEFDIKNDQLIITSSDIDYSAGAEETLPCEFNSEPMRVRLKSELLLSILQHIHTNQVHIHLSEPEKAVTFFPEENEENEELLYLAMPYLIHT